MQFEQIKQEKNSLKREFKVTIPASNVQEKVDQRLKAIGKNLKMPGFRPGKVPLNVIKKQHNKQVMGEALELVVEESSREVLKKEGIRPAIQPKIEITSFKEGEDLKYNMKLEVLPEVPEIDFTKISIERPKVTVKDSDVEELLERMLKEVKNFKKVDVARAAKIGDAVLIDFKGFIDDKAFEGGEAKNHLLELGSKAFIEGFEKQLEDANAGDEKIIKVTFPKEYHSDKLAGKLAKFEVKVHEIHENVPQELNDDFAKKLGFDDVSGFKNALRQQLEKEVETTCRSHAKKELFDVLDEACSFEIPEEMSNMEFNAIWAQVESAKKANPKSPEFDKPEEDLKNEYKKMADRRVRLGILLAEIGNKNKFEITAEELNRAVIKEAMMYPGQERKVVQYYQDNPQNIESLRGPILEEKVVDFILQKVTIRDKEQTFEELQEQE